MSPRSPKIAPSRGNRSPSADADPDAVAKTEESRLFREAVRDVKPLYGAVTRRQVPQQLPPRARARPSARFSRADRLAVLEESLRDDTVDPALASGEALVFHREGVPSSVLRKLRRGEYRVQAQIDLHGLTVLEAKAALREFLAEALLRHWRCVRIVHGKGLRSGHRGPVLKTMAATVLRRLGPVIAYVSARQVDGGTGALYVLLSS